jgi:DNA-binding NarL/FixJ family response regulator
VSGPGAFSSDRPAGHRGIRLFTGSIRSTASFIAPRVDLGDAERVAVRCVIVDDNIDFLDSASRLLSAEGIEVVGRASSGSSALRLAHEVQPDVILLDVLLGGEDGFEVANRLAAAVPQSRIVLISTQPKDELADGLRESPAIGFISKRLLRADAVAALLA